MTDSSVNSAYYVESLARGLSILSLFAEGKAALSLTDIAENLQLNKTTTFRLLFTLETLGYLQRDRQTKLYQPALEVLRLGLAVLNSLKIRQVAIPYLQHLAIEISETVSLVVLDKAKALYIDRFGRQHTLNIDHSIGSRLPLHCTATGKALLAFLPPDRLQAILAQITWERYTNKTLITPEAFQAELERVREQGFATSLGELRPDLGMVAAPIHQGEAQPVMAIGISAPMPHLSPQRMSDELGPKAIETARQISAALGDTPSP